MSIRKFHNTQIKLPECKKRKDVLDPRHESEFCQRGCSESICHFLWLKPPMVLVIGVGGITGILRQWAFGLNQTKYSRPPGASGAIIVFLPRCLLGLNKESGSPLLSQIVMPRNRKICMCVHFCERCIRLTQLLPLPFSEGSMYRLLSDFTSMITFKHNHHGKRIEV